MIRKPIYFSGPDGCGKTTFLKSVEGIIIKQNVNCKHVWIRSPKILSKPLMGFCRLINLTKYEVISGIRYGMHEFYRSKLVSLVFPFLQLIDFKIKWLIIRKNIPSDSILLFDRFSLDTLVDLMVDTHRWDLHKTWIGRSLIKTIPPNTHMIVLTTREDEIRSRKLDTRYDPVLKDKIYAFNILCKDLNIKTIDNNREFETVLSDVLNSIMTIDEGDKKKDSK